MSSIKHAKHSVEILEQRIAPAGLIEAGFKQAAFGANLVTAGEGLTTGNGAGSGQYLLYVEKGTAMVFFTDLNNNFTVDPNELTGVAAGDGLSLISFVNIHGDIVTNLTAGLELTDGDRNPANNPPDLGGDGLLLLNSSIEKIELRSVRASDFSANASTDTDGDGVVDDLYVSNRLAPSTYSIFGNILVGGTFGSNSGGLIIDDAGRSLQEAKFGPASVDFFIDFEPSIGSIATGTKAGGQNFAFGISRGTDTAGTLLAFVPATGQAGGDIIGVKSVNPITTFNINTLQAGSGGIGARGGNIANVQVNGDSAGYLVLAGDGGRGTTGGAGGSVTNFADLGSVTGFVLIQSGDGGVGTTGVGGAGGTVSLGTMNAAAGLNVVLGSGGDGFTAGGNAGSLPKASFAPEEGDVPFGLNITATKHVPGRIGSSAQVDFDGDGLGDYVFTTSAPDQIVAVLGKVDPVTGQPIKIYLQGPKNVTAVQVGDFNGDGHDDVAVASNDPGNAGGISVFLNRFDPTNTFFDGFGLAQYSPLPTLNQTGGAVTLGFSRSASSIFSMAAGDFDGDVNRYTDIAVVATYWEYTGSIVEPSQVLLTMKNDVEGGKATGRFYADFGIKGDEANNGAIPYIELTGAGTPGSYIAKASAGVLGGADFVYVANTTQADPEGKSINTYEMVPTGIDPSVLSVRLNGTYDLGQVDTNRNLPQGTNNNITLQDAFSLDFTILDFGGAPPAGDPAIPSAADGAADLAVVTVDGYVITLLGSVGNPGSGLGRATSNPNLSDSQNSGIFFGAPVNGRGGFNVGTELKAIRTIDADGDHKIDEVAVLNYSGTPLFRVHSLDLNAPESTVAPPAPNSPQTNGLGAIVGTISVPGDGRDPTVVAFDTYNLRVTPAPAADPWSSLVAVPTKDAQKQHIIFGLNGTTLVDNSINVTAGDGGDALVGRGGVGGSIGSGGVKLAVSSNGERIGVGTVDVLIPENPAYRASVNFIGGAGGNGFSTGGAGGKVSGVSVHYVDSARTLTAAVSLKGGKGGFGIVGAGGAGGSVAGNSVESGNLFVAGDGGRGNTGGAGGSVTGNGLKGVYDTSDPTVFLTAGIGGAGVKRGGAGGDISGFHVQAIPIIAFSGGALKFKAGDGGSAAAGPGGRGGSIINSSPMDNINAMGGEISLRAGDGGDGTVGGAGGGITNFKNKPTTGDNPSIVTFIAGNGGNGTSGNGGVGGSIVDAITPSSGRQDPGQPFVSGFLFNRIIAGSGGSSGGAAGGAGGSINNVDVSTSDGAIAFVAGAGGRGLAVGGAGGSVRSSATTLGVFTEAKVLVVAGSGGDAYAFLQNPLDVPGLPAQKPFGGKIGKGGVGGSIIGFTESLGVQAEVDLIAGNGGSTVNYGTITSPSFVGKGGSISNVSIAGNVGSGHAVNITDPSLNPPLGNVELRDRANVPIKSYTDVDGNGIDDQTMDEFIQQNFRAPSNVELNDVLGNVGIVVGAAGRLKLAETSPGIYTSLPANGGVNGSLSDVTARNLLSAVAGSVNQIAAIQAVTGLKIGAGTGANFTPGVVGSDKDPTLFVPPFTPGADPTLGSIFDYLDVNGQGNLEPQLDGRLIDGAVVARAISGFVSGRVYLR